MHTKCKKRILAQQFPGFAGIRFAYTSKNTLRAVPLNSYGEPQQNGQFCSRTSRKGLS